jgi:trimethylamine corrinoid protein
MSDLMKDIRQAVLDYDEEQVRKLVAEAIGRTMDPVEVMNEGLLKTIREAGDRFGEGRMFLAELTLAANACRAGLDIVKQRIRETGQGKMKAKGVIVIGTVEGDVHNIGKDVIRALLEASGYLVHDIGVDQPAENFVKKAIEVNADIIASSALLTTTRMQQRIIEDKLFEAGIRDKVKTIIGGGAADENWAKEVGCDFYAGDAAKALLIVKHICEGQNLED